MARLAGRRKGGPTSARSPGNRARGPREEDECQWGSEQHDGQKTLQPPPYSLGNDEARDRSLSADAAWSGAPKEALSWR
jgi:hypothetical protein